MLVGLVLNMMTTMHGAKKTIKVIRSDIVVAQVDAYFLLENSNISK